ncbi:7TM diverse intracellular signaling domain-containing protein [Pedobacter sp. ASV28]|uniref:sensor histidine kinase n=1 Tax=Pedobacter sp. ASV28 TaxID=2795123 RepID=UPI001E3ED03C|nr:7TM diverse intracellular signaling domain-containing protein [Pedobacter sp. ASV28]
MRKNVFYFISTCLLVFLIPIGLHAKDDGKTIKVDRFYIYEDQTHQETINSVAKKDFVPTKSNILNYGLSKSIYWIKFNLNTQPTNNTLIYLDQSRLSVAEMYLVKNDKITSVPQFLGLPSKLAQGVSFNLNTNIDSHTDIYLKLQTKEMFIVPIKVYEKSTLLDFFSMRQVFFGIYTGIMAVMFIYNLFLFVIIRDRNYLFYIFYILFTWLAQITIQGYAIKYFWSENSPINDYATVLFSCMAILFANLFTISFLEIKTYFKIGYNVLTVIFVLIIGNILLIFIAGNYIAFILMQVITSVGALIALLIAIYVYFKKHFKPAGFYLVAWSILLIGTFMFIMKDYGFIPYNNFTIYLLQISAGIEVILLSFALADKINFFKKENELAQAQALSASLENQRLIKEQNVVLEQKVKERTEELESANGTLNITLNNLKSAQSQLVDAEKMAALGQLTAGIAHEINNPINFVTSNVKPLQLDIDDLKEIIKKYENIDLTGDIEAQIHQIEAYKKQIDLDFVNNEITSLLSGINEGAKRTAEIIRSLRNFSRLDESDMKPIDLNEGLLSTLVLVRNNLPDNLTVIKDLGNLPKVECMPGKINQVFMNLVSNAIQAIKIKEVQQKEEFLTIKSWYDKQQVFISIKDTGTGMSEEVKHRIFEPFFTTKDIGEGTGLGLSIVFSIIEKHKGNIEVNSKLGEGTEFIITLQVNTP